MAAVVLDKLGRQIALAPAHAIASRSGTDALIADLSATAWRCAAAGSRCHCDARARTRCGSLSRLVETLYAIERRARRTPLRRVVGARAQSRCAAISSAVWNSRNERRRPPLQPRILTTWNRASPTPATTNCATCNALPWAGRTKRGCSICSLQRARLAQTLGLCLRRDPGNALLRHLSDLEQQFRVLQCLEANRAADAEAVLVRARSARSSARRFW